MSGKEINTMNIYEKMNKITAEVGNVKKNLKVEMGKGSYKAVGEADVLFAVKEQEEKYRVYSYPAKREIVEVKTLVSKYGTESMFLRLETVYRFVNIDKPEEYIEVTTYGDGVDTQDKAPGKAMTYGDKYALLKAYKIVTGDDPDQRMSEEMKDKKSKATTAPAGEIKPPKTVDKAEIIALKNLAGEKNVNINVVLKSANVEKIEDLTATQYDVLMRRLHKTEKKPIGGDVPEGA